MFKIDLKLPQACYRLFQLTSPAQEAKYRAAQISAVDKDLRHRGDEKSYLVNVPKRFYSGMDVLQAKQANRRSS